MAQMPRQQRGAGEAAGQLIEVGWLLLGPLDPVDREAVAAAREQLLDAMRRDFPRFTWRMPSVERRELVRVVREEPTALLVYGEAEREAKHWDFALVVTAADLVSYSKPYALATPSRSISVAVLSTSRIDPQALGAEASFEERREVIARRLVALARHLFGHLNGLDHEEEPSAAMYDLGSPADLDQMEAYSPSAREHLARELEAVADVRLEEASPTRRPLLFYLRAAWFNRHDIASSVRQARPWLFPVRLPRLTTAAGSALLILLVTAEVWDLGMSQRPAVVVALAGGILAATTAFVLERQGLLVRRGSGHLTELTAITNLAVTLSVALGLATTYAALFVLILTLAWAIFPAALVAEWTLSLGGHVSAEHYLRLAGFVASLGLLIGALGASFEEQHYFRHIAYVDEET